MSSSWRIKVSSKVYFIAATMETDIGGNRLATVALTTLSTSNIRQVVWEQVVVNVTKVKGSSVSLLLFIELSTTCEGVWDDCQQLEQQLDHDHVKRYVSSVPIRQVSSTIVHHPMAATIRSSYATHVLQCRHTNAILERYRCHSVLMLPKAAFTNIITHFLLLLDLYSISMSSGKCQGWSLWSHQSGYSFIALCHPSYSISSHCCLFDTWLSSLMVLRDKCDYPSPWFICVLSRDPAIEAQESTSSFVGGTSISASTCVWRQGWNHDAVYSDISICEGWCHSMLRFSVVPLIRGCTY